MGSNRRRGSLSSRTRRSRSSLHHANSQFKDDVESDDLQAVDLAVQSVHSSTLYPMLRRWTDASIKATLHDLLRNLYDQLHPFRSTRRTLAHSKRSATGGRARRASHTKMLARDDGPTQELWSLREDSYGFFFDALGHHQVVLDGTGSNMSKVGSWHGHVLGLRRAVANRGVHMGGLQVTVRPRYVEAKGDGDLVMWGDDVVFQSKRSDHSPSLPRVFASLPHSGPARGNQPQPPEAAVDI